MNLSNSEEFEQCKIRLKEIIKELISSNQMKEAQEVIDEYEAIVKNDVDIQLFRSQIRFSQRPYSCEVIVNNTDSKTIPEPGENIYSSRRNVAETMGNDDIPLVSVIVLAYNNLEKYTKQCIEYILKYTNEIDYELILIDNGSTDGTFEYFKSVQHKKKKLVKITKNLGSCYGTNQGFRLAEGTYVMGISNDVFVTKNWLTNLLKCALSDESIGMVVPASSNTSNLQNIDLEFTNLTEMQEIAAKYNVSDYRKWHERLRLITPAALYRKTCLDVIGWQDYGFFHDFSDDDISFRVRRAGYKAILCKDVFVHHAGGFKSSDDYRKSLEIGRKCFQDKYHGIDAWDDVNNYETIMVNYISIKDNYEDDIPNILGIDILCGTPILEVKNKLREYGICNPRLSAFSTQAKYWADLKTICNGKVEVDRSEYILEHFYNELFDYILLGQPINTYYQPYTFLKHLIQILKSGGQLLVKLKNSYDIGTLLKIIGLNVLTDSKSVLEHISIDELNDQLTNLNCVIKNISIEQYHIDSSIQSGLNKIEFIKESDFQKATARNFVLNVVKL